MEKEDVRILIVDDERDLLESLRTHLEIDGYQVKTTDSATKALKLVASEPFHIILTDINMPLMDGIELLEGTKSIRGDTIVIMITAYTTLTKVLASRSHGAFDYILKPFRDLNEIDEVIERAYRTVERWQNVMEETTMVRKKNLGAQLIAEICPQTSNTVAKTTNQEKGPGY